jgi:hypothetical protein
MSSNIFLHVFRQTTRLFLILAPIVLLSSCGKVNQEQEREENVFISHLKQQDIPVPVGFSPIEDPSKATAAPSNTISLCYKGNLNIDQSVHFYKQSMELNGWEIQDFSTKQEGLLFCNKTSRKCAISIRKNSQTSSHKTDLHLLLHDQQRQKPVKQAEKRKVSRRGFNPSVGIDVINTKELSLS